MRGILLILIVTVIALIFVYQTGASDEGDCYDEVLKLTIKRGETVYPEGKCLRMSCYNDGEIHLEPCMFEIPDNCHIVEGDMSQKFPECCPNVKCTDE